MKVVTNGLEGNQWTCLMVSYFGFNFAIIIYIQFSSIVFCKLFYPAFKATIVHIETNDPKISGVGENTPLGPFYLPAYAEGTRTGIAMLAPYLIGKDPTNLAAINRVMDAALKGHPYVKSALDMACWDIFGNLYVIYLVAG